MKKKVLISVASIVVAIILIVAITLISIVMCIDTTNNIDFDDKVYATSHDAPIDISIASYNVKSGYSTVDNLTKINEQITNYGVDIVGLQEVDSDKMPRSHKLKCTSTLASGAYTQHFYGPTSSLFLGNNYGIMSMSRHTLKESTRLVLPAPSKMFYLIGEPRVCLRNVINIDGVDIAFYNTHLSFENGIKMKNKDEMRKSQIDFILEVMESDPCQYKVLVGDFNILSFDELAVFTDNGYQMINNEGNMYNSYRGDDVTFKCLDNIIYTSNMELVSSEMIDNDLSDHNMLYAHLRIS